MNSVKKSDSEGDMKNLKNLTKKSNLTLKIDPTISHVEQIELSERANRVINREPESGDLDNLGELNTNESSVDEDEQDIETGAIVLPSVYVQERMGNLDKAVRNGRYKRKKQHCAKYCSRCIIGVFIFYVLFAVGIFTLWILFSSNIIEYFNISESRCLDCSVVQKDKEIVIVNNTVQNITYSTVQNITQNITHDN